MVLHTQERREAGVTTLQKAWRWSVVEPPGRGALRVRPCRGRGTKAAPADSPCLPPWIWILTPTHVGQVEMRAQQGGSAPLHPGLQPPRLSFPGGLLSSAGTAKTYVFYVFRFEAVNILQYFMAFPPSLNTIS